MAALRRFGLAYRGPYASVSSSCPLSDFHTRARPMAALAHMCILGDDQSAALLDEEFDELSCEPGVLLQLVNQA